MSPRITLTPEGVAILERCQDMQRQLDALHDALKDERAKLLPLCPIAIGDRLEPATRYQPGLQVEHITATTDDDGVIWTVRGHALTKTGKVHATQHAYRYVYGTKPEAEPQA